MNARLWSLYWFGIFATLGLLIIGVSQAVQSAPSNHAAPIAPATTFTATFHKEGYHGSEKNVAMNATPCVLAGGSVWVCNVTLWNYAGTEVKSFNGLDYNSTLSFAFVSANPTLPTHIAPHNQIWFNLWFQVLAGSGAVHADVFLRIMVA